MIMILIILQGVLVIDQGVLMAGIDQEAIKIILMYDLNNVMMAILQ